MALQQGMEYKTEYLNMRTVSILIVVAAIDVQTIYIV